MREGVREWASYNASKKSHLTRLYFDFMSGNGFSNLMQHLDEYFIFFSFLFFNVILFDSQPL